MDRKLKQCAENLRRLVSDVQGAPYPGEVDPELYLIWYEHIQKTAIECFEFLDENIPDDRSEIDKALSGVK